MTEADRKLAGAVVIMAWAAAFAAVGSAVVSDRLSDGGAAHARAPVAEAAPASSDSMLAIHRAALTLEREAACLAQAIYYEARGESNAGKLAVAEVVMNRVRSGNYPSSICGVVYQGASRATGCQFSFTCDGSLKKPVDKLAWQKAERLARNVVLGHAESLVGSATHYHAAYVDPYWADSLERTTRIGRHIFYTTPGQAPRG
jgi:spore germination cell wall hydrolase CwlJ-like protein